MFVFYNYKFFITVIKTLYDKSKKKEERTYGLYRLCSIQ